MRPYVLMFKYKSQKELIEHTPIALTHSSFYDHLISRLPQEKNMVYKYHKQEN